MIRLFQGLQNLVQALEAEKIGYMIVGGFAMSYYNRFRVTTDIDCVLQIYSPQVGRIVNHFPEWLPFVPAFRENAERGIVFNLTDFESGVKFDFMVYQDSDYNWTAFKRKHQVDFMGIECYIAAPEDLIISNRYGLF